MRNLMNVVIRGGRKNISGGEVSWLGLRSNAISATPGFYFS